MSEAQQATLGSMIIDNECIAVVANRVTLDMFTSGQNRLIWSAIMALDAEKMPIDLLTLRDKLGDNLKEAGGIEYLVSVAESVVHSASAEHYAKIVESKYLDSNISMASVKISSISKKTDSPDDKIAEIEQVVAGISKQCSDDTYQHASEVICSFEVDHTEYIQTQFTELNAQCIGMGKGQLIIVMAATSMGKTAFMMDLFRYLGYEQQLPCALFSCEMSNKENKQRICSTVSGVSYKQAMQGFISGDDKEMLYEAERQLNDRPMYFDKTPGLTPSRLRRKLTHSQRVHGTKIAFVDHLHNMKASKRTEGRRAELAYISKEIKDLAVELDMPIVLGAQINRGVASRDEKRPRLSDIRDCGEVEEAADQVWSPFRPMYYGISDPNELLRLKGRNCGMGSVGLDWSDNLASFSNPIRKSF